jgi:hypothetical protein
MAKVIVEHEVGDCVCLKGERPGLGNGDKGTPMTIVDVGKDEVMCTWLDANKHKQKDTFPLASIENLEPGTGRYN